jgi:hypothetical protein
VIVVGAEREQFVSADLLAALIAVRAKAGTKAAACAVFEDSGTVRKSLSPPEPSKKFTG